MKSVVTGDMVVTQTGILTLTFYTELTIHHARTRSIRDWR